MPINIKQCNLRSLTPIQSATLPWHICSKQLIETLSELAFLFYAPEIKKDSSFISRMNSYILSREYT